MAMEIWTWWWAVPQTPQGPAWSLSCWAMGQEDSGLARSQSLICHPVIRLATLIMMATRTLWWREPNQAILPATSFPHILAMAGVFSLWRRQCRWGLGP